MHHKSVHSLWFLLALAPLALSGCASQPSTANEASASDASAKADQALSTAQQALQTAQKAESEAQEADQRAGRMYQQSMQK